MKRVIVIVVTMMLAGSGLQAQDAETQQALAVLKTMSVNYQQASHLAFDVVYRYAAENAPSVYLDSVEGHFKMNGTRYWYMLDSTESINTSDYVIMLFKQDKMMYLAKPSSGSAVSGNIVTAAANPVSNLENYFTNNKNISCRVLDAGLQQIVTIEFIVPEVYKSVEYHINKKTGYLVKMVSRVRAEQLYDASVRAQIEGGVTWAIVETVYSNHRRNDFDDSVFDSARYFKKEGSEYVTVGPYGEYKVFLGSAGL
jgi:hypothetical protein